MTHDDAGDLLCPASYHASRYAFPTPGVWTSMPSAMLIHDDVPSSERLTGG